MSALLKRAASVALLVAIVSTPQSIALSQPAATAPASAPTSTPTQDLQRLCGTSVDPSRQPASSRDWFRTRGADR